MPKINVRHKFVDNVSINVHKAYLKVFEDIIPIYIGSYNFTQALAINQGSFTPPKLVAYYSSERYKQKIKIFWEAPISDYFTVKCFMDENATVDT